MHKINDRLIDNGLDLQYQKRSVLTTLGIGNIIYVSASGGNDALALVGRSDRPFKTIQAAANIMAGINSHLIILPGTYNEQVTIARNASGVIELMPLAHIIYNGTDDRFTLNIANENMLLKGAGYKLCSIQRLGTGTGGGVKFGAYYGNISAMEGISVISSGTGAAVDQINYMKDCKVTSSGGYGVFAANYMGGQYNNCHIQSTVSAAVFCMGRPSFTNCYVKGQTYGVLEGNGAGIKAKNSTVWGVTEDGVYGNNWNWGSLIENSTFRGFKIPLNLRTYNYTDSNKSTHIIRNSQLICDDPAALYSAHTWYLVGQCILANKALQNYFPLLEQDITVLDNLYFNEAIHSTTAFEII